MCTDEKKEAERKLSILEIEALGRELWEGVDAAEHVAAERESWDDPLAGEVASPVD